MTKLFERPLPVFPGRFGWGREVQFFHEARTLAGETLRRNPFPEGHVHDDLPNAVRSSEGPLRGGLGGERAEDMPDRIAVPGVAVNDPVVFREDVLGFVHRFLLTSKSHITG